VISLSGSPILYPSRNLTTGPTVLAAPGGGGSTVYATWNPSDKNSAVTLSGNDLTAQVLDNANSIASVRATLSKASGKYYFEVTINSGSVASGNECWLGIANSTQTLASQAPGGSVNSWAYGNAGGFRYNGAGGSSSTYASGAVVMVAVDLGTGRIWFGKDGTFSGDPAAGTGAAFSSVTGSIFPIFGSADHPSFPGYGITANFGASAFSHTPPSGFGGWFS